MKSLHINQGVITLGGLTIKNPHKVMIKSNKHWGLHSVETKKDYFSAGERIRGTVLVDEKGYFNIDDLKVDKSNKL